MEHGLDGFYGFSQIFLFLRENPLDLRHPHSVFFVLKILTCNLQPSNL